MERKRDTRAQNDLEQRTGGVKRKRKTHKTAPKRKTHKIQDTGITTQNKFDTLAQDTEESGEDTYTDTDTNSNSETESNSDDTQNYTL